jgi:hypothetical protein
MLNMVSIKDNSPCSFWRLIHDEGVGPLNKLPAADAAKNSANSQCATNNICIVYRKAIKYDVLHM